jgi:hypothetical protein
MRNRMFHQARIGGMAFDGIISGDGPYLSCQLNGGVALGVSGLRQFQPGSSGTRRIPPFGWWVVKYSDEERIFLPDFGHAAIRALSDEFGLPVLTERGFNPTDGVRRVMQRLLPSILLACWLPPVPELSTAEKFKFS